ncbi:hypothetical protein GN956_G10246 [Arapaima gigas]
MTPDREKSSMNNWFNLGSDVTPIISAGLSTENKAAVAAPRSISARVAPPRQRHEKNRLYKVLQPECEWKVQCDGVVLVSSGVRPPLFPGKNVDERGVTELTVVLAQREKVDLRRLTLAKRGEDLPAGQPMDATSNAQSSRR